MRGVFLLVLLFSLRLPLWAQGVPLLSGQVRDAVTGQPVPYATLAVQGAVSGATANAQGAFSLRVKQPPPFVLLVRSVGYALAEHEITSLTDPVIFLTPQPLQAREVVVTASRVAESSLQSPVTVEQLDPLALRQTPAPTFFEALEGVKGLQMTTASLGFRVPNARGFANPTNVRFVQLVDGVDNQAPVIGAALANAAGPSELDLERVEVIPGPASALYGMNALNGLVNFFTKNPFDYQGLSVYQRTGLNHLGPSPVGPQLLSETAVRYARAYGNRWAFKMNLSYLRGHDWVAHQTLDLHPQANASVGLLGEDNPALDPVSAYGNERPNQRTLPLQGKNYVVARTGYYEKDITDYRLRNLKGDLALHYRLTPRLEASYTLRVGQTDNVYQRTNRFRLADYLVAQQVVQVQGPRLQARAYLTREVSGRSYNLRSLAENLDRSFKTDDRWFSDYRTGFEQSLAAGAGVEESHRAARTLADAGRFEPGTARYDSVYRRLIAVNNWDEGAALRTRASLFHAEGQYDLSELVKVARVLVGADYRLYSVFPDGNYFINPVREGQNLLYRKGGGFVQLSRQLLQERLLLSAALRYDRNEYFRGVLNPRVAAVYTWRENHNLRLSYQNGYRFPSLFEAFSNVNSGGVKRVGGLPVMSAGIFEDAYLRSSIDAFTAAVNRQVNQQGTPLRQAIAQQAGLLRKSGYAYIQPERVNAWEAGYKSLTLHNRLYLDADVYFSAYSYFIAQVEVNQTIDRSLPADSIPYHLYQRSRQQRYRLWTNSTGTVYTYGSSLGLRYRVFGSYTLSGNGSYARLHRKTTNDGLEEAFNTPPWIANLSLGNPELTRRLGFQVGWHWQHAFRWESALGTGDVPAYSSLDAQVSLRVPEAKMLLKAGGTNLLNRPYFQMVAGPSIGGLYYVTLVFDERMGR